MRLDQMLFEQGLFPSREKARRAVMANIVEVDGQRVDKPGTQIAATATLRVVEVREPFVSRAGRKLAAALDAFSLDMTDCVCLDIGASTGGFTDCMLQRGARSVCAVDVGYGQLDATLRADPRVEVRERVNARHLAADAFDRAFDRITVDVSFISLRKVVPALLPHLARPHGRLLTLVKPQFEAGRHLVGKGGVIRDEGIRRGVIESTVASLVDLGLSLEGCIDSPVAGVKGNREAVAMFAPGDS